MSETAMDKQGAGLLHITNTIRRAAHIYDDTNDMDIRLARFIARYMHDNGYRRVSTNESPPPLYTDGPNRRTILAQPADTNPEERQMKQPDWSTAPEGATHYYPEDTGAVGRFYNMNKSPMWVDFCGGAGWQVSNNKPEGLWLDTLVARPAPQWDGKGLPPVGVVCEAYWPHDTEPKWYSFEAKYVGETHVVAVLDGTEEHYGTSAFERHEVRFRPARTPEQIAAEEREAAIKEMSEVVKTQFSFGWVFEKLYDAGYRMTAEDER